MVAILLRAYAILRLSPESDFQEGAQKSSFLLRSVALGPTPNQILLYDLILTVYKKILDQLSCWANRKRISVAAYSIQKRTCIALLPNWHGQPTRPLRS